MDKPHGKPENFLPAQVTALRRALIDVAQRRKLTQAEVGEELGITQQNAGRLMNLRNVAGLSYLTAYKIAELAGHDGVEAFFEAQGVSVRQLSQGADPWWRRSIAVRAALRSGYRQSAIDRVLERHQDAQYQSRPTPWWTERFRMEHEDEVANETGAAIEAATDEAAEKLRRKHPKPAPKAPRPHRRAG